jgi:lipopolysaccharide/colanic/teichoic acid biosynthesis glycosyltransferase
VLGWCTPLARFLVKRSARCVPLSQRERYREEWLAEVASLGQRGLSAVVYALGTAVAARRIAWPEGAARRGEIGRRTLDLVIASVVLVAIAPLTLLISLLVAHSLGRPIVMRQRRVGKDGERIIIHKFRTRHPYVPGRSDTSSSVGRWLTRFGFDELPQLYDVIRGDMSLVGPRPQLESDLQDGSAPRCRPGLTLGATTFEERQQAADEYATSHRPIRAYLRRLAETVVVMFRRG